MEIKFTKIINDTIFTEEFNNMTERNKISFPSSGIVVVYAPNGTGKTSLMKAMGGDENTQIEFEIDGTKYNSGEEVFHIIKDQNQRDIIAGETSEFFLGDNIRREFQLQGLVEQSRKDTLEDFINALKTDFGISSASSPLIEIISDESIKDLVRSCANSHQKGGSYTDESLFNLMDGMNTQIINDFSQEKMEFFKKDYVKRDSLLKLVENAVNAVFTVDVHAHEIEENTEAINILKRFDVNKCIVCDNKNYNRTALLDSKVNNRERIINALDEKVKMALEHALTLVWDEQDPFAIKKCIIDAVENGSNFSLEELLTEIGKYKQILYCQINNKICEVRNRYNFTEYYREYRDLVDHTLEITDEAYQYIKNIITYNMRGDLEVVRDKNKKIKITYADREILNESRTKLPMSTGEQNFISLSFEMLKAKSKGMPVVVIDDPISSFDSIYKNKIIYALVKILEGQNRILLTHNTDLLRLLEAQYSNAYKLYILNNTPGEQNGFIPISNAEKIMIINLEKLLKNIRQSVPNHIKDNRLYLMSMIPFMRGYANIVNNNDAFDKLTKVMHGYMRDSIDIAEIYVELFGENSNIPCSYIISVSDILKFDIHEVPDILTNDYPLLNRTLKHTFTYLYLRLLVENKLVSKYEIKTAGRELTLGKIIDEAFPDQKDVSQMTNRIMLNSKKTLINEFNHFEGNLSIFQPAIDISDKSLEDEKEDIIAFVNSL